MYEGGDCGWPLLFIDEYLCYNYPLNVLTLLQISTTPAWLISLSYLLIYRVLYCIWHGPLARYVKLWVAHEPGMPGTFSLPPRVSDPDMHHGKCATHVLWCMPGSLTSGFLWSRWRGKNSRHSRRMRNPQFYVSGMRPMLHIHFMTT